MAALSLPSAATYRWGPTVLPPKGEKMSIIFFTGTVWRLTAREITKNENESTVRTQRVVTLFTFGNEVMIFLKNSRILRSRITK